MVNKSISILLIAVLFGVTIVNPLMAQTDKSKQEKKAEKVKAKIKKLGVGEKVKVKVELYNDTIYQGYISESNEDSFVVNDKNGNLNTVKYDDVDKIGGKNLSTGAKIAIGIGIGAGATLLTLYLVFLAITRNN